MVNWKTVGRVAVSSIFLVALFWLLGKQGIKDHLSVLTLADVVILSGFCSISLAFLAKRYQLVVASRHRQIASWRAFFGVQLMGLTMNQFLPGMYGGDVLRAMYFMPRCENETKFFTACVVFERICGLLAMIGIGVVSSLAVWIFHSHKGWLLLTCVLMAVLAILLAMLKIYSHSSLRYRVVHKWLQISRDVIDLLFQLQRNRRLLLTTVLCSVCSQCFSILTYWYLLDRLNVELPISGIAAVVTLGWLMTLLPISLNGLGIRETGLVAGFLAFGVTKSTALAVSIIALLPTLLHAAIGAVLIGYNLQTIINLKEVVRAR